MTACSDVSDSLSDPSDHVAVLSATDVDHDFNRHVWSEPSPGETNEWMEEVSAPKAFIYLSLSDLLLFYSLTTRNIVMRKNKISRRGEGDNR